MDPVLVAELEANPNVLRVTDRHIEYRDEFKQRAVAEYLAGRSRREIFEEAGLDVRAIGMERVRSALGNWLTKWKRGLPVAGRMGRPPSPSGLEEELAETKARLERALQALELYRQLLRLDRRHQPQKQPPKGTRR